LRFPNVPVSARLPTSDQLDSEGAVDFNELRPAKILVVDDNEQNCNLIAGMFKGTHHQLEFGVDGREAVTKAQAIGPDILLLDVRMPNLDGHQALELLRKTPDLQLLPVIAVTASNLLDEQKGLPEKFSGYLRKPFTRRELFNELAHFIPRRTESEDSPVEAQPHPKDSPAVTDTLASLVAKLRTLESQEWPGLRDSVAVNEARAFASRLENLALDADCEQLMTYAETLAHYAETYTVDALERQLHQFPAIIERIARPGK
jgi:CheY-like chemotaxis protein